MLPEMVYKFLMIVISIIGGVYFWIRYASIITRDNMNYQEYNWNFNPNTVETGSTTTGSDPWASLENSFGTCIGQSCCSSGQVYDSSMNQCVVPTSTPSTSTPAPTTSTTSATPAPAASATTTESFDVMKSINSILTKKQPNKYKDDYNMRPNYHAKPSKNVIQ